MIAVVAGKYIHSILFYSIQGSYFPPMEISSVQGVYGCVCLVLCIGRVCVCLVLCRGVCTYVWCVVWCGVCACGVGSVNYPHVFWPYVRVAWVSDCGRGLLSLTWIFSVWVLNLKLQLLRFLVTGSTEVHT